MACSQSAQTNNYQDFKYEIPSTKQLSEWTVVKNTFISGKRWVANGQKMSGMLYKSVCNN